MRHVLEIAQEFGTLFSRYEHALKRCGFLRPGRPDAQADWRAFAGVLGEAFFLEVVEGNIASALIAQPPGKLMREGLAWQRPLGPLVNSAELFEQGVCRVRNSLFHGEKLVGDRAQLQRDHRLIEEALAVLKAAATRVPAVHEYLK